MSDEIEAIEKLDTSKTYKWSDTFIKMLEEFRNIEICDEALAWCENQNTLYPSATFGEIMENFLADSNADASWAAMNLMVYGDQLDKKLRTGYFSKIEDPVQAWGLAHNLPWISQPDIVVLTKLYEGNTPHYEG